MMNPEVDGIFTDCYSRTCEHHCSNQLVHTDFFAFRPNAMVKGHFGSPTNKKDNAERHATEAFQHIIKNGRDRWLPGSKQNGNCRVIHPDIIHEHSYLNEC